MFNNKVCVITGGANGIGRCLVEEYHRLGCYVAFIDTNNQRGEDIIQTFPNTFFYCGDISEKETLDAFCHEIIIKYGKIDFLINNAMISKKGIKSNCTYEDFENVLKVGIMAPYYLAKSLYHYFSDKAVIINITSTRTHMSQIDTESYSAAKGGLSSLTHALAISLGPKVRVNSIAPGWIDTSKYNQEKINLTYADHHQHPVSRVGKPEDIAKMAIFLCSEDASFITGQEFVVDGGMTKLMIYHNDYGWYKKEDR